MSRRGERGEGRLGFIVALSVCLCLGYVGYKIIPVRISAYEFRDTLRQECRLGAVRSSDAQVKKRILQKAEELELPVEKKQVTVRRTSGEMIVSAQYEIPIDLKVTTYTYRFTAEERAPLF